jgi:asparagine synthetase B (glutamine-hydrolysing)
MYKNKYFVSIFGNKRMHLCQRLEQYVGSGVTISKSRECSYYVHQIYDTGLPEKPVIHDGVSLLMHGIVFPWCVMLDKFSANPKHYLSQIIDKYRSKLTHICLGFRNGSYCGVLHDKKNDDFFAFTSFLNSIPVYYAEVDGCLIVSNDLTLVAIITQAELKMAIGLVEYYIQGTNLSENTAFKDIKSLPKGAYMHYKNGIISVDYYYIMPKEDKSLRFNDVVDEFAQIWESNINALHSEKYKYGLGLTGGIDSRLIFSAMENKNKPLFFTGSHPDHPDYLIAKIITESLGINNHKLEDYRKCDKLKGYAEYLAICDNPLTINSLYTIDQMQFRKKYNLTYTFEGGINLYGGEHYYKDRRSLFDTIIRSTILLKTKYERGFHNDEILINLLLRNNTLKDDINYFPIILQEAYRTNLKQFINVAFKQLGNIEHKQQYLERLRHIYKSTNLLTHNHLASRRINEAIVPEMNIELTNFACKTPLQYRNSRRILLAYLKKFHPGISKFVLSNNVFSANSPWVIHKTFSHYIKAFNALGYKVPLMQWYIKKHNYKSIDKLSEVYIFQKKVCEDSDFLNNSSFEVMYSKYSNDKTRLMRLFNLAVFAKRVELGEDRLKEYLLEKAEKAKKVLLSHSKKG